LHQTKTLEAIMATDTWLGGTANWDTPSDWRAGLPDASSDVWILFDGSPEVTASFGTVNSIENQCAVTFIDAGASSVTSSVETNFGSSLDLDASRGDGGSSLTIGGRLTNAGLLEIGNSMLSAASTVQAGRLVNAGGTIDLTGSPTAEATLDVASAASFGAAGGLYGNVNLSGDALIEFKSGQITTIGTNSELSLIGSEAFVADASDTSSNSALKGLTNIYSDGTLALNNGATVTTSGALTNGPDGAAITLDGSPGDGGSSLTIGGTLTNSGTVSIGNATLSASGMLKAASVVNDGTIDLHGDQSAGVEAILHTHGAFTNDGSVNLSSDVLSNNDKIAGPVSGTGDFGLSNDSTLNFGSSVSSGERATFQGVDKLILGQPSSFDGTIDDFFHQGDIVVAKGFGGATTLLYSQGANSCSLTLTDGANKAVLNFTGAPYTKSDFALLPWYGGAGSAIKFVG
jgi:hypothetical protein